MPPKVENYTCPAYSYSDLAIGQTFMVRNSFGVHIWRKSGNSQALFIWSSSLYDEGVHTIDEDTWGGIHGSDGCYILPPLLAELELADLPNSTNTEQS